jgi:hypothetical protein
MSYTSGPWTFENIPYDPLGLGLSSVERLITAQRPGANENFGDVICTLSEVDEYGGAIANGNLIAAAPELLEVLKELLDNGGAHTGAIELSTGFDGEKWAERAELIVAKAEGR